MAESHLPASKYFDRGGSLGPSPVRYHNCSHGSGRLRDARATAPSSGRSVHDARATIRSSGGRVHDARATVRSSRGHVRDARATTRASGGCFHDTRATVRFIALGCAQLRPFFLGARLPPGRTFKWDTATSPPAVSLYAKIHPRRLS